jgi:hypothetical protein
MPTAKTVLRKTHQEAVVKVAGTAAAQTISLASDLLPTGQVLDGGTQTVNIVGATWTGAIGGVVTIARNSVTIMTLVGDNPGQIDLGGQSMIPDTINNTSDIVVTISGAQAECWLKLRKVGGYKTTIEPEQFSVYDNPAVAGS